MMAKKRIQDTTRDAAEDSTGFEKRALGKNSAIYCFQKSFASKRC